MTSPCPPVGYASRAVRATFHVPRAFGWHARRAMPFGVEAVVARPPAIHPPPTSEPVKRSTLITLAVIAGVVALFFIMTAGQAQHECTVCMEYRGARNCATASGPDQQQAFEGARTTACGPITSGMDQSIACGNATPASVQCH